MIPVNFEPTTVASEGITLYYPLWTVIGTVVVAAIIGGLFLWYKSKKINEEPKS
jgi:hypothetical protein